MIGPGRWIATENVQHFEMVTKYSAIFFGKFDEYFVSLCNNSDPTLFFNTITFARSRGRCYKPRAKFLTSLEGPGKH